MINQEQKDKIKGLILNYISDDYTQIGGITGNLKLYDTPDLAKDEALLKEYILSSVKDLLDENKVRVGVLSDDPQKLFLNYWQVPSEEIISKLDKEWSSYFDSKTWDYSKNPTFDLTESYAKEIGKYESDQDKLERERSKK